MRYAIVRNSDGTVDNLVEGEPEGIAKVYGSRTDVYAVALRDDFEHAGAGWVATGDPDLRFTHLDSKVREQALSYDELLLWKADEFADRIEKARALPPTDPAPADDV